MPFVWGSALDRKAGLSTQPDGLLGDWQGRWEQSCQDLVCGGQLSLALRLAGVAEDWSPLAFTHGSRPRRERPLASSVAFRAEAVL